MTDAQYEAISSLRNLIFGRQRDLIDRCGGYKRVMDLVQKSKSEVNRWQGGADQDYMPTWAIYILEKDCGQLMITGVLAEANGRRLTDPEEERRSEVNLHRAYAETVRKRGEVDLAYAAAIEDGYISHSEAVVIGRALSGQERATSELQAAVAVVKARGGVEPGAALRVVWED
jgi:hypothetical protein